ncbi:MAG: hypothetical protein ACI8O8_002552, partial [Oleiphilaceae bacterium]
YGFFYSIINIELEEKRQAGIGLAFEYLYALAIQIS